VEVEVHRRGYAMLLGSAGYSADQQAARVKRMLDQKVAALIAYPIDQEFDTALFENLVRRNIPLVLGDRYLPGLVVDTVVPDNVGGAYLAVAHLAALGHRRIAFVTTDNLATSSVAERLLGYRLALEANQGGYDPRLILSSPTTPRAWPAGPGPAAQTSARIAEFLERAAPTAVFALHDRLALDVYTAAAICGLRIPEDLSVVGFDDDLVASAASPALSTVAQPWEQMGRRMATMVLDRLEGSRDDADVLRLVLPTRLLIRASTAARKLSVSRESRYSPGG
jgi:LacI family transcriptional regulator